MSDQDKDTDKTKKLFDALTSAQGEARFATSREAHASAALSQAEKEYRAAADRRSAALDAEAAARQALADHLGLYKP